MGPLLRPFYFILFLYIFQAEEGGGEDEGVFFFCLKDKKDWFTYITLPKSQRGKKLFSCSALCSVCM